VAGGVREEIAKLRSRVKKDERVPPTATDGASVGVPSARGHLAAQTLAATTASPRPREANIPACFLRVLGRMDELPDLERGILIGRLMEVALAGLQSLRPNAPTPARSPD
jgi:hypothetical protein